MNIGLNPNCRILINECWTKSSYNKCEIFSHLHTPDMIISDAVRISMSIPIIFNPHRIYIKNQYGERVIDTNKQNALYVDGGLLNNYPISMFDTKRSVNNNGYIENNYINSETLGFRLVSTELKTNYEKSFEILTNNSNDEKFSSYLQMLFNFYWLSEGNSHTEKIKDKERTIYIDTLSMGVLDFDLSIEDKKKLIKSGQDAIESFLQLNRNKKFLKRTNSNNQYALAFRKKGLCYLNSHNNNNNNDENDDNISQKFLKYYRKASMIDLNLAEEYYCKGYILKKEKKLNEANEYFRKAIELNPELQSLISFEESIKEEEAVEYDFDLENKKDDFLPESVDNLKSTEVNDNNNDESKKEVLKLFRNRNLIGNDFLIKKLENNTDFDD